MKKFKKKFIAAAMAGMMLFSMAGCGKSSGDDKTTSSGVATEEAESDSTDEPSSSSDPSDATGSFDLPAIEFTRLMGNGINLGNTMEATGRSKDAKAPNVKACETAWGAPETTQEMINAMKAAGFDTLRMPVAWTNMMDYTKNDYTIDPLYLDRVEEIAKWAIDADMYVVINDHWDYQWFGQFGDADQAVRDEAWKHYEEMWKQIAERFKDYDEHILFEGANEELGDRLNDDWHNGSVQTGTLTEDECYETVNAINQKFVDVVRASGGNNAQRYLIAAGYNTDIKKTSDDRFKMPTDTADKKLILSVHYYDPGDFALRGLNEWGTKDEYTEMSNALKSLGKFTNQGYGVFIGEYGALPTNDTGVKKDTAKYTKAILDNCDEYDLIPVLWDTNWLFDRNQGKIIDADTEAIFKARNAASEAGKDYADIQAAAQASKQEAYDAASEGFALADDEAMAWIMYQSGDWNTSYCVGDVYDPTAFTAGVAPTDVKITGAGTYTVSLDFTATSGKYTEGCQFMALGMGNGELLYPGYVIDIKEVKVNGNPITLMGKAYTCSDDKKCTRVNLYNQWVSDSDVEKGFGDEESNFRTADGDASGATAQVIQKAEQNGADTQITKCELLEITFDFVAPQ